eukprot:CAMPEP_0170170294 /NCGR_PEP_ID=MMETSP0040_2-20121228/3268_1 /TAXON_ID=641309 /ORGANISM="Lotharella oceanica, Strain CCMP622" /LENGTH=120 /DNA_ID=CAMNT_0010409599 /DNA_START=88 /DNA_END=449 /DNA_ORIENTATION=-
MKKAKGKVQVHRQLSPTWAGDMSRLAGLGLFANRASKGKGGEEGEVIARFDFEEEAFDPELTNTEFQDLREELEEDRTSDEDLSHRPPQLEKPKGETPRRVVCGHRMGCDVVRGRPKALA